MSATELWREKYLWCPALDKKAHTWRSCGPGQEKRRNIYPLSVECRLLLKHNILDSTHGKYYIFFHCYVNSICWV